ncbi:hypothetical protein MTO96_016453 [Rhipicephalus appendiculatus]
MTPLYMSHNRRMAEEREPKPPARKRKAPRPASLLPLRTSGTPLSFEHEEATDECLRRVGCDIRELEFYRVPGVFISAEQNNIAKIHALILGPPRHALRGRLLPLPDEVSARLPQQSSARTPHDHGRRAREVRAELARERQGVPGPPGHFDGTHVELRGSALRVLPTLGRWQSEKICYNAVLQHETIRVAVCDAVEQCLAGTSACPSPLKDVVLKHFPQFYGEYEKAVKKQLHLSGTRMNDSHEADVPTYQFDTLLERLAQLRERVKVANGAAAGKSSK